MSDPVPTPTPPAAPAASVRRLLLELGPLVVFFAANHWGGIMAATAAFMLAMPVSLLVARRLDGRWPLMPLVTTGFVLLFGGLTLWLHDDTFIKVKATIIYLLFAVGLAVGAWAGRNPLALVMVGLELDDAGWRVLTRRWVAFLLLVAGANEAVWRLMSTDDWVTFKSLIVMPLFLVFSLAQAPLILRHQRPDAGAS